MISKSSFLCSKDYILQNFNVGFTEWQIFSKVVEVWKGGVYPVGQHRAVLVEMPRLGFHLHSCIKVFTGKEILQ